MRRKTWSLVGLEHAVIETILLGQIEIGLHRTRRIVHITKLRIEAHQATARIVDRDILRAVHLAAIVHRNEIVMPVAEVVAGIQWNRRQRNGVAFDILAAGGDVHTRLEGGIAAEQIIRRTVFLEDDDDVTEGGGSMERPGEEQRQRGSLNHGGTMRHQCYLAVCRADTLPWARYPGQY